VVGLSGGPGGSDPAATEAGAAEVPAVDGSAEERREPYLLSLALQRGPYPYEQRTVVVAALDAVTASESHPDEWLKAIKRAHKEGGDVRVIRLALDADIVTALFEEGSSPRRADVASEGEGGRARYAVRLAFCFEEPPVVVAAVDEEMAVSMGIDLGGPFRVMPVFYRRQVGKAFGEVREVIVAVPRAAVERAFAPSPVPATIVTFLGRNDPRF
jgi:hypothetical protein